ncbi:hypothetical protein ebD32 [Aromatoleum aromaticum EbN1]|uniref:Uncharacterized protein n=1 Tax=Aromatoleum aromaticum (strain DSM 19018 / LMG 30748 / EbN1) TaxID=76114 RepID=Q5P821_AROAE|nr:hypothetical protein [Aromatoleum aromaticum]CAI06540.1 hypothetical protein ebD32 [Aromatoleum aromaticum EbN1]
MMPEVLFRHPDGDGSVTVAGARLIVVNGVEDATASVSIGPAGLRALAEKLREIADRMEASK